MNGVVHLNGVAHLILNKTIHMKSCTFINLHLLILFLLTNKKGTVDNLLQTHLSASMNIDVQLQQNCQSILLRAEFSACDTYINLHNVINEH